ncbi:hypothetical protein RND71_042058 [Anisodus tanguticus]|uniref:non-specific serine/threonine protein kinase n=1 Tax=Anisodus tanguticus TaxID=243964 RepID=A0AAE1URW0_9SOLA|nr:hypothetical protein RND71_042058 [Anisodus tanguticus]
MRRRAPPKDCCQKIELTHRVEPSQSSWSRVDQAVSLLTKPLDLAVQDELTEPSKSLTVDQIALKKLKSMNSKAEMEFAVEVEVLGRVSRKNLLGLRGYCAGNEQRLIVHDYMPNLSLLSHLHGHLSREVQLD